MNKELLLKVADEIEADPNYSGKNWIGADGCGCAMVRMIKAAGAEFEERGPSFSGERYKSFVLKGFGVGSTSWDIPKAVEFVTKIPRVTWEYFADYSLKASAADTAAKLREMAETGRFQP